LIAAGATEQSRNSGRHGRPTRLVDQFASAFGPPFCKSNSGTSGAVTVSRSLSRSVTAALDLVCRKIHPDRDSNELRKLIADELIRRAQAAGITLIELQKAGMNILQETGKRAKSGWFGWWKTK
jgi:hypothetical protein